MQHSIHIYLGKEMASIAEAISSHLKLHGNNIKDYVHIIKWEKENGVHVIEELVAEPQTTTITDAVLGKNYFNQLFAKTINIGKVGIDVSSNFYVCLYVQLYDKEQQKVLASILEWIKDSGKAYIVDVYGIVDDLAYLFCKSDAEKKALLYKSEDLKRNTFDCCNYIIDSKNEDAQLINRFLMLQNSNQTGIGLDLDRNTFIRIFGEYAILSAEQYDDLYPSVMVNRPDVTSLGISALWFDRVFFTDYLLKHSFITVLEREGIGLKKIEDPSVLLKKSKGFVINNLSILSSYLNDNLYRKIDLGEIKTLLDSLPGIRQRILYFEQSLKSITEDKDLNLLEKRVLLSLLLREDDALMDENLMLEDIPTLDDCYSEALDLYVNTNNKMEKGVLQVPQNEDGTIYSPLDELKKIKTNIRQSKSFIRKSEQRMETIKDIYKISEDSRNVYNPGDFTFGDTTYHLQRDIVEKPLKETYVPKVTPLDAVDLRSSFSEIRDQGQLGACTAFATSSIFEYILNSHDHSPVHSLSPRFLYYNVSEKDISGIPEDKGSSFYDVIESLEDNGICEEALCIYAEDFTQSPSQEAVEDAKKRLVTRAENVKINHKDITSALTEGYPVAISLNLYKSFHHPVSGFIFRPSDTEIKNNEFEGRHAMVICGYSEKKKIYIVRNSWSKSFGDNGYCYIPFSYIDDPHLCNQACIISGISCNELIDEKIIKANIEFDLEDKNIEYAILRIAIEEEKHNLTLLEEVYNNLNEHYIRLINDLSNPLKRNAIKDYALSQINTKTKTSTETQGGDKKTVQVPKYGSVKWGVAIGGILLSLALFFIFLPLAIVSILIFITLSLYLFTATTTEQKEEETFAITKLIVGEDNKVLKTKIKFEMAAMLIDSVKDLKDELEKEHRRLVSFICNLSEWRNQHYKAYKKMQKELQDNIRPPFTTILSEEDFSKIYNKMEKKYIGDISLSKEFKRYKVDDTAIQKFYNSFISKIENGIEKSYSSFSMNKYLMGETFGFLDYNVKTVDSWFALIENQSKPFVETVTGQSTNNRRMLFVQEENNEQQNKWHDFCANKYSISPSLYYGGNMYKLTYVQMEDLKKEDLKIFNMN